MQGTKKMKEKIASPRLQKNRLPTFVFMGKSSTFVASLFPLLSSTMFIRTLSFTFALLILFQSCGKLWILLSFQWNKAYIAATLCENRENAALKCGGNCFLQKELKQSEERERQIPQSLKEKSEPMSMAQASAGLLPERCVHSFELPFNGVYLLKALPVLSRDIFAPPKISPLFLS